MRAQLPGELLQAQHGEATPGRGRQGPIPPSRPRRRSPTCTAPGQSTPADENCLLTAPADGRIIHVSPPGSEGLRGGRRPRTPALGFPDHRRRAVNRPGGDGFPIATAVAAAPAWPGREAEPRIGACRDPGLPPCRGATGWSRSPARRRPIRSTRPRCWLPTRHPRRGWPRSTPTAGCVMFLMMAEVLHLAAGGRRPSRTARSGSSWPTTRSTSSGSAARCTT